MNEDQWRLSRSSRPSYLPTVLSIVRGEGLRGLYQGLTPNVIGAGSAWGFYFLFYNAFKSSLQGGNTRHQLTAAHHLVAASASGVLTLSFPFVVAFHRQHEAKHELERERERQQRAGSPDHKKLKRDAETSDGEKSDQDLVVDDANESSAGAANGNHHSPRENGIDGKKSPRSPGSESSSGGKKKEDSGKKSSLRSTPTAKPLGNVPQMPSKIKRKEFYFYQQNVGYTVSVIVLIH